MGHQEKEDRLKVGHSFHITCYCHITAGRIDCIKFSADDIWFLNFAVTIRVSLFAGFSSSRETGRGFSKILGIPRIREISGKISR